MRRPLFGGATPVTGLTNLFQAVEVRVGPQGVKAEWVRIELRKVETLPGGGQTNIFYDFVGPSPVNLWTASEETGPLLRTVRVNLRSSSTPPNSGSM